MSDAKKQRLLQLMADQTTGDLSQSEREEMTKLSATFPDIDPNSMDYAAAAAALAYVDREARIPKALRDRLLVDAAAYLGASVHTLPPREATVPRHTSTPWPWFAAAALFLVALIGWWPEPTQPNATERLEQLISSADVVTVDFGATQDPYAEGAGGQVVWSRRQQEGYMRIEGLHANDPTVDQYQLWIFDKDRDARYPIDGGVFDIDGDTVIIPIDARLAVAEPTLFAITVEAPGGVVVSNRERIVLAAQVN